MLDRENRAQAEAGGHVGHRLVDLRERPARSDHALEVEPPGTPQADEAGDVGLE